MKQDNSILGVKVDVTSYEKSVNQITKWAKQHRSCYVIAANVHVVMTAYFNRAYKEVVDNSSLVTPDGMPLVKGLQFLGYSEAQRVYGPDLMLYCCRKAAAENLSIFLYGSTETVLSALQNKLFRLYPNLKIAGAYSPPFRQLSIEEEKSHIDLIHKSQADIVFVSLGCPRQEEWMYRQYGSLNAVMIGVGAAFLFHSGDVKQAPRWMMKLGLEWFFRLLSEPRRLWKRYFFNNPAFLFLFFIQLLKHIFSS